MDSVDEKDEKEVTRQLTKEIAEGLGAPWKAELPTEDNWQYRILGENEAKLYISLLPTGYKNKKDRVSISGGLHVGHNGQYVEVYENNQKVYAGSITVALKRGVPAIVKEIQRRYLPEYLRILGLAIAKRDAENDYINTRRAKLEELAKIVGVDLSRWDRGYNNRDRESFSLGNIEVRVGSDVTLKISSLTMDETKAILKLVKGKQ